MQPSSGRDETRPDAQFHGQNIRGTAGEDCQRNVRADESIGYFVDGSVAPGRDDELSSFAGAFARDYGRIAGAAGGNRSNVMAMGV